MHIRKVRALIALLIGISSLNFSMTSAHAAYSFSDVTATTATVNFVTNSPGGNSSFGGTGDNWQCILWQGAVIVGNVAGIAASIHNVTFTGLSPSSTYSVECVDLTTLATYDVTNESFTTLTAPILSTEISFPNLYFAPPVVGEIPVTDITSTFEYTGTVSWAGPTSAGRFQQQISYMAVVTLTPVAGYTATGLDSQYFAVPGATSVNITFNGGTGSTTIQVNFPATGCLLTIDAFTPYAGYFGGAETMIGTNLDRADFIAVGYSDSLGVVEHDIPKSHFTSQSTTSITFRLPAINSFGRRPSSWDPSDMVSGSIVATSGTSFYVWAISNPFLGDNYRVGFISISEPPLAAPAFTLSRTSETTTVGNAITGYTITSTGGAIASYSVAPSINNALNNGLSFNTETGLITGTPIDLAQVGYQITGTNAAGSFSAEYLLTVNVAAAPAFTLSRTSETTTVGNAIAGYTITSTGGAIADYSISPAIGNGLDFSVKTGLITGTPTAAAAAVTYTITGTNTLGPATAIYQITVNAALPPVVTSPIAAPVEVPDPIQQSKIAALSMSSAVAGTPSPIVISGSFIEKISAIQINGAPLAAGSWSQTATSVSFTMPAKSAGTYEIQLFNGAAPVLKSQSFTFTAPVVAVTPTPIPTVKAQLSIIKCVKDSRVRRIRGINPTCPDGYVKR
jgi:hypothetical protein